ncbi:ATP-binding protein [Fusibacter bizertensis]|uniref:histidine kinase n=1 Tax=Fusibacter bizertensis TaxID=1488331 RepID=A0ABT6NDL2_9FIRM|nr:ATP-binding protein [Fusibacter bizertensis]MDH8678492.1 ATP-binding protein [Fusibacter bizertensis]
MLRSIRSRFTIIYFLLVFIAMIIAGIFIVQSLEDYNLNVVSKRLDDISQIMMSELAKVETDDLSEVKVELQETLDRHVDIGLREEMFIIDSKTHDIIATSTENINRDVTEILNDNLVIEGLIGNTIEKNIELSQSVKTKDKVYPIFKNNKQLGVIYLRYDLNDIYESISMARMIIFRAIVTSLLVTIVIGFIISKSITDPINEVTKKATLLAEGDFNQFVEIKSEDEIGTLSSTFNFLAGELKRGISEITREKSKLEAIINYMEDGLIAINAEGKIIHSNPKAIKMLANEDQFDDDLIGDLLSIYNSGRVESGVGTKTITAKGLVLKVNFAPFLDEESNRVGIVFVLQDITEAQKLENMRREFVANVSHELKTPITSIKSYTETILEGRVDDPELQKVFLEVVNTEADRMSRLVSDLLELSNFDSNSTKIKKSVQNLDVLIDNCILKLQVTADQKKQVFTKHYSIPPIVANIDKDKIEQVILNILSNAIKYSVEAGTIDIELRLGEDETEFDIVIRDTGMGIPDEDLGRIFERFYRVDKARTRAHGGTGLGLSIAKEIVEAHQGRIRIESEVNYGTKVTICLPFDMKNV